MAAVLSQQMARLHGRLGFGIALSAGFLTLTTRTSAEPGTHPMAVSVWDARASSVVLGGLTGLRQDGGSTDLGAFANFSSTRGTLSAQFGAHYVGMREGSRRFYGVSGTGAAVFVWPLMGRHENGVPRVGLGWSLGVAPAALISGEVNYMTAPLLTALALPLSPTEAVTITPFAEAAPSLNLDSRFQPVTLDYADYGRFVDLDTGDVRLDSTTAADLFAESASLEFGGGFSARGGVFFDLHLSDRVSFVFKAVVASVGDIGDADAVLHLGGALAWRWDRIVPAVLPASRRLAEEDCADVAERYRACTVQSPPEDDAARPPATPASPPPASPAGREPVDPGPRPAIPCSAPTGAGPSETQPWPRPVASPSRAAPPAAPPEPPPVPVTPPVPPAPPPEPAESTAPPAAPPSPGPSPGAGRLPDVE
ncbi:MAG: hypothetical protein JW751_08280 [Polyangiaceae bacterium]|nr:hypothetical protein [Polyangiaceae bacterium]